MYVAVLLLAQFAASAADYTHMPTCSVILLRLKKQIAGAEHVHTTLCVHTALLELAAVKNSYSHSSLHFNEPLQTKATPF